MNNPSEKTVLPERKASAAAGTAAPAKTTVVTDASDHDQHYKIKKEAFHPESKEAEALLDVAIKLDNASARVANKMLALGRGQSKHAYKRENQGKPQKNVAYSDSTAKGMYEIMHVYIGWALNRGKLTPGMKLRNLIPFVQEFLDEKKKTCAAGTVHTYVSQICKVLDLNMTDYNYPPRRRADTVAHRSAPEVFPAVSAKYPEVIGFSLAAGTRKYKELARLKGTDLQRGEDGLTLRIHGKGGLIRQAPVVGTAEAELVERLCREAGAGRVFPRLPANLDLHAIRAMYACSIYLMHARDVSMLPNEERYECRADYKGIVLDIAAMEAASRAIGHTRIGVISQSYLWPIEPYLRGGILASPLPQTFQKTE